jgi:hypothetical protein
VAKPPLKSPAPQAKALLRPKVTANASEVIMAVSSWGMVPIDDWTLSGPGKKVKLIILQKNK